MTDYVLVAGMGLGGWSWGQVWGRLTAPRERPPRLYKAHPVGKVICWDPPQQPPASTNQGAKPTLEAYSTQLAADVDGHGLHSVVLVGHGGAAPIVLGAAATLKVPPKRVVLLGGILPEAGRSSVSVVAAPLRLAFSLTSLVNASRQKEFRLPKAFITSYLCNGMDPLEVIQVVGWFQPLRVSALKARVPKYPALSCPITYVVLTQDRLVPPRLQRRMAQRLATAEMVDLDACHAAMLHRPKEVAQTLLRYV